jgi:hypothetical protein
MEAMEGQWKLSHGPEHGDSVRSEIRMESDMQGA